MSTKNAMTECKLKYFSSLTAKQKDETVRFIRILKNGLNNLNPELAMTILKSRPINVVLEESNQIDAMLKGQKMFKYKTVYLPLNFKL